MEDFENQYKDSSSKYMQGELPSLPPEFDSIIKSLDKEREIAYKKTKGLFKKSFIKVWLGVIAITTITVFIFSGDRSIIFGVGGFLGAAASAIGAGTYTLLKKGSALIDISLKMKKELVSKIVKVVNPALDFSEKGVSKEEYEKAGLVSGSKFKSEDSITGTINGQNVIISECQLTTYRSGNRNSGTSTSSVEVTFNGVFIQLELSSINLSSPLTVIPSFALSSDFIKVLGSFKTNQPTLASYRVKVEEKDKISIDPALQKSEYEFFCKDKQVATSFINQARLKILDYIFDKYKDERESSTNSFLKDFPINLDKNARSGVYISFVGNKLNLALDWNEDLFEVNALKESIEETGLAQKVYRDLLFINQIINEVSLLDKVNG